MLKTLASTASLLLGSFIMLLGNSLLVIALPLKMSEAGFQTEITGVVMAGYFAGLLVGAIYGKRVIGEVGHIRAFAGFAALMAASTLAYPMHLGAVAWLLLRFIGGVCVAGLFAALESWLNERSSNETRGRVLSIYMVVNYLGIMLGQFMINLWDVGTLEVFMMAAMLISLCLVPVVLTRASAPDISQIRPLSLIALYRASPLGVVGCVASGTVMGAYYGMGAIFAERIGLSVFEVSVFMGSVILGGLLLQWPIGRLSDRFSRRHVMFAMLVLLLLDCGAGVAAVLLGFPFETLLVIGVLLGGGATVLYPISLAQAYDYLNPDQFVSATSGLLLAYSVGATAGPIVAAFAISWFGPPAFFGFILLVSALLAAFLVWRMYARAPLPAEEREPFVVMPRTSPVIAELDPRAESVEAGRAPAEAAPRSSPSD